MRKPIRHSTLFTAVLAAWLSAVPANPATTAPTITANGIVPLFSKATTIESGEWVSIFGTNLAPSQMSWNGDFPTTLNGTSVTINGKSAYLYYVSPTQINLQAPSDTATGTVPVVVTTATGKVTATVTLGQFAPSFSLLDSRHVTGIILRQDGSGAYGNGTYDIIGPTGKSLGYPTVAARPGDSVVLYALGLGATNPAVPAGQPFSGAAQTANPVKVLINNASVTPDFAGLSSILLDQINLKIPANAGVGDVPLIASVGGVETPAGIVISLQAPIPLPVLQSLSLSPNSVLSGVGTTGTVSISTPAPAGGTVVSLSSNKPNAVSVPASVTVPAGANSATFAVSPGVVTANTTVTLTASYNGTSRTANLSVILPQVQNLSFSPAGEVNYGTTVTGTVTLNVPAPAGGAVVSLASSDPNGAPVPAMVTIAAGTTATTFSLTTGQITSTETIMVTASYDGVSQSANIYLLAPPTPQLLSLTFSPTVIAGGGTATGTIILSYPALMAGAVISLASSDSNAAPVPSSIMIAGGGKSGTFTITAGTVSAAETVTITATLSGIPLKASLTVWPPVNPNCTNIGGTWYVSESGSGTATLTAAGQTDSETQSLYGSGTVPITQADCSIQFNTVSTGLGDGSSLPRTGTVSGNNVSVTGALATLAAVEAGEETENPGLVINSVNVSSNVMNASGQVSGNTMTLNESGTFMATGNFSYSGFNGPFSLTITTTSTANFNWAMGTRPSVRTSGHAIEVHVTPTLTRATEEQRNTIQSLLSAAFRKALRIGD